MIQPPCRHYEEYHEVPHFMLHLFCETLFLFRQVRPPQVELSLKMFAGQPVPEDVRGVRLCLQASWNKSVLRIATLACHPSRTK